MSVKLVDPEHGRDRSIGSGRHVALPHDVLGREAQDRQLLLGLRDRARESVEALADLDLVGDGGFVADVRRLEARRDLAVPESGRFEVGLRDFFAICSQRGRGQSQEETQDEGDAYLHCLAINSTIVDGPAAPAENLTSPSAVSLDS